MGWPVPLPPREEWVDAGSLPSAEEDSQGAVTLRDGTVWVREGDAWVDQRLFDHFSVRKHNRVQPAAERAIRLVRAGDTGSSAVQELAEAADLDDVALLEAAHELQRFAWRRDGELREELRKAGELLWSACEYARKRHIGAD